MTARQLLGREARMSSHRLSLAVWLNDEPRQPRQSGPARTFTELSLMHPHKVRGSDQGQCFVQSGFSLCFSAILLHSQHGQTGSLA